METKFKKQIQDLKNQSPEFGAYVELLVEEDQRLSKMIQDVTNEFVKVAQEKKFPLKNGTVDSEIFEVVPCKAVYGNNIPASKWKFVDTKKGTSEKTMFDVATKMPLVQAIAQCTQMLKNGTFDAPGTFREIFLTETRNGKPLKLCCYRYPEDLLYLHVYTVSRHRVWLVPNFAWLVYK